MSDRDSPTPQIFTMVAFLIIAVLLSIAWYSNVGSNCEGVVVQNYFGWPECVAAGEEK